MINVLQQLAMNIAGNMPKAAQMFFFIMAVILLGLSINALATVINILGWLIITIFYG